MEISIYPLDIISLKIFLVKMTGHDIAPDKFFLTEKYWSNPKYWDRWTFVNGVDPDQMLHSAASDQGLHCWPYIANNLDTSTGSRMDYFKF